MEQLFPGYVIKFPTWFHIHLSYIIYSVGNAVIQFEEHVANNTVSVLTNLLCIRYDRQLQIEWITTKQSEQNDWNNQSYTILTTPQQFEYVLFGCYIKAGGYRDEVLSDYSWYRTSFVTLRLIDWGGSSFTRGRVVISVDYFTEIASFALSVTTVISFVLVFVHLDNMCRDVDPLAAH